MIPRYEVRLAAIIAMVTLCLMGFSAPLEADRLDQGRSTASFLKLDPFAESASMGSAYLGRSGAASTYFNPAGLAYVNRTDAFVTQNEIFANITYRNLSFATPASGNYGGFGVSITSVDFGSQQRTHVRNNNPITGLGRFGANDLAVSGSYGFEPLPSLAVGAGLKYVKSDIAGYQDGTLSGDVGLQYRTPINGLAVGLSGRNLFGELELNRRSDPLPRIYETGLNYQWNLSPGYHEFHLGLGVGQSHNSNRYVFGGLEYELYRLVSFRVGQNGAQEADNGLTVGAGLQYGNFSVDYAYVPFGDLGNQQRFSFSYRFGKPGKNGSNAVVNLSKKQGDANPQDDSISGVSLTEELSDARDLYYEEKYEKSLTKLRYLKKKFPKNTAVLLWLGKVIFATGDTNKALSLMHEVKRIEPKNPYVDYNIKYLQAILDDERSRDDTTVKSPKQPSVDE